MSRSPKTSTTQPKTPPTITHISSSLTSSPARSGPPITTQPPYPNNNFNNDNNTDTIEFLTSGMDIDIPNPVSLESTTNPSDETPDPDPLNPLLLDEACFEHTFHLPNLPSKEKTVGQHLASLNKESERWVEQIRG